MSASTATRHARLPVLLAALALALGALLLAGRAQAIDPLPFKDHAQEVRFQNLTEQLRCLVCQNESLAASQADLAEQMRRIIFRQMQQGRTDEQIKQYLVDRYSDYVLYDPPLKPSTWLLWFGPGVVLLAGAVVVAFTVRRRSVGAPRVATTRNDDDDW